MVIGGIVSTLRAQAALPGPRGLAVRGLRRFVQGASA